jgi:signal peptidase II
METNMNPALRYFYILFLVIANVGCDQLSKNVARKNLTYYETKNIIGDHFVFTKIENSGAFLSVGDSIPYAVKFVLLSLLPLFALSYGLYYLLKNPQLPSLFILGLCFVIGGGLGNLFDRFMYGSVTDFMHINFYIFKTGIFNLADVSIMTGMAMILINTYSRRLFPDSTPG